MNKTIFIVLITVFCCSSLVFAETIQVFGTEYYPGDNGKIFVQVLKDVLTPVNNASCFATIYKPDGSIWLDEVRMTYQNNSNGLYFYDFTVNNITGVYMVEAYCEYDVYQAINYADQTTLIKGWYVSGNGSDLTQEDSVPLWVQERNYGKGNTSVGTTVLMGHMDNPLYANTVLYDDSYVANNGVYYNGAVTTPGILSSGTYFDGVDDYGFIPNNVAYTVNASDSLMVCFGFNHSISEPNGDYILDAFGSSADGWRFTWEGGNEIRFRTDRTGTGGQDVTTPTSYTSGTWHTVCGYSSLTTMTIYVDGILSVTASKTQSGALPVTDGITIGAKYPGTDKFSTVSLDELCIVKGIFSNPATFASNYNTAKTCGAADFSLEINAFIPNVTELERATHYELSTTYIYDDPGYEPIDIYVYNFSGSSWFQLENGLIYSLNYNTISDRVNASLYNISEFINSSNDQFKVKYVDAWPYGGTVGNLKLDYVKLIQENFLQKIVTGAGEIHVNSPTSATFFEMIWEWLTTTLWDKIIGIDSKVNQTVNNTNIIINNTNILIEQVQGNSTENASIKEILTRPRMQIVTY